MCIRDSFTGALPRAEMDPNAALSAPQATLMTTIAQGDVYKRQMYYVPLF